MFHIVLATAWANCAFALSRAARVRGRTKRAQRCAPWQERSTDRNQHVALHDFPRTIGGPIKMNLVHHNVGDAVLVGAFRLPKSAAHSAFKDTPGEFEAPCRNKFAGSSYAGYAWRFTQCIPTPNIPLPLPGPPSGGGGGGMDIIEMYLTLILRSKDTAAAFTGKTANAAIRASNDDGQK